MKHATILRTLLSITLALVFLLGHSSLAQAANQLAGHPSPYLAMHADDPVHWRSWQREVFTEARAGNRLVLVSVGYFSCHWCHVMQRESYQDPAITALLNNRYLSVKVDRELEPDLDQRLMDFVEQVRGVAGWPLHVLLTPEGYPLTGFTYLAPEDFKRVLERLDAEWQQDHVKLGASARAFFESAMVDSGDQPGATELSSTQLFDAFTNQALQEADSLQGGFGNISKFPNVPQLDSLLASLTTSDSDNPEVVEFVQLSLQAMRSQNLQDHIDGGFFRYTIDPDWQTPHFEKMLYDNAMLATLYLRAHRLWPNEGYAGNALQTLDFIESRLLHPEGGYVSSLSAVDQDNREGGAYLWDNEQLSARLDADELEYLEQYWQKTAINDGFLLRPTQLDGDSAKTRVAERLLRKLQLGNGASMPYDDKRLASWNAMTLRALVHAADHAPRFAERARRHYALMLEIFFVEDVLVRLAGNARTVDTVFEDYAETAYAFLLYAQAFDDASAMRRARRLVEEAYHRFFREGRWQAKEQSLIPINQGKWVMQDLVLYSPMTLWLRSALALPDLDSSIRTSATDMLQRQSESMTQRPFYYGSFIQLRTRHPG